MGSSKTLLLNNRQISQKINRIAYQIFENNFNEKSLVIAGMDERGFLLAERIEKILKQISKIEISLVRIIIDRQNIARGEIKLEPAPALENKVVLVVDDVMNSGKTLMYGIKFFLDFPIKKLSTVVLVDRDHKYFPVKTDFAGLTVSTTMQEHISLVFKENGEMEAFLE